MNIEFLKKLSVSVLLIKSVFIVLGPGVVAIAALPVVLYLLGFTAAGVMDRTIAAILF